MRFGERNRVRSQFSGANRCAVLPRVPRAEIDHSHYMSRRRADKDRQSRLARPCARNAAQRAVPTFQNSLFWHKGGDNFLKARVAAERIP
jgi:hypothetical protein